MTLEQPTRLGHLYLDTSLLASSSSATARIEDLQELNRTAIGAIITKSGTLLEREGNPETNYYNDGKLCVNAKGLPGPNIDDTLKMLREFNPERKKPVILSLAGMLPGEYRQLVQAVRHDIGKTFDAIELNLSCPNVQGKPIISYDPESVEEITAEILSEFPDLCLGVKIAPFFSESDQSYLKTKIQEYLYYASPGWCVEFDNNDFYSKRDLGKLTVFLNKLQARGLKFVSATNTFPNCRLTDVSDCSIINPKANQGRAGLSGDFLRPVSVSNVRFLKKHLHPDVAIIGTGGVRDRQTADQFFQAGANMVAIGTSLVEHGPKAIEQILLS